MNTIYQPISSYWNATLPPALLGNPLGNTDYWTVAQQLQQNVADTAREVQDTQQAHQLDIETQTLDDARLHAQRQHYVQAIQRQHQLPPSHTDPELMRQQLRQLTDSM